VGLLESSKIAVIFPGQGSQSVGMGLDLANTHSIAAEMFAKANDILGFSLSGLCFEGPEDELTRTVNTQPALFVSSAIAYEVARAKGLEASFSAGHSVGEYAALYAAGAFSFEDGLRLVRKRAELMDKAARENGGAMAAILGLSPDQVKEATINASDAGVVVAANFNSPIQTVISGQLEAVEKACVIAKEMGAKRIVPLKVSGAFHSPLMQSAADEMRSVLAGTTMTDCRIPVVANITGDFEQSADEIKANLARQVVGTVRWIDSIEKLILSGVDTFVELGPGNVLAGLVKRISTQVNVYSAGDNASINALFAE